MLIQLIKWCRCKNYTDKNEIETVIYERHQIQLERINNAYSVNMKEGTQPNHSIYCEILFSIARDKRMEINNSKRYILAYICGCVENIKITFILSQGLSYFMADITYVFVIFHTRLRFFPLFAAFFALQGMEITEIFTLNWLAMKNYLQFIALHVICTWLHCILCI